MNNVTKLPTLVSNTIPAIDLSSLQFDIEALDGAIAESGLHIEFDQLPQGIHRKIAADMMVICSVALQAETDEQFQQFLSDVDAVEDSDQASFLKGFLEHLKTAIDQEMGEFLRAEGLRDSMFARLRTARNVLTAIH